MRELRGSLIVRVTFLGGAMALLLAFAQPAGAKKAAAAQPPAPPPVAQKPAEEHASAAKPDAKPDAKPVDPKVAGQQEFAAAVAALTKEFRDKKLRPRSDYFTSNPAPDITTDMVFAALGHPIGGESACDAYIKWQMLSLIPGKVSEEHVPQMLEAFVNHPKLSERPGVTLASRTELVKDTAKCTGEQEAAINAEFGKRLQKVLADNEPILKYSDELFAKLPPTLPVVGAGFNEIMARVEIGVSSDLSNTMLTVTRAWAGTNPAPEQLKNVRDTLNKLLEKMNKKVSEAPQPSDTAVTLLGVYDPADEQHAAHVMNTAGGKVVTPAKKPAAAAAGKTQELKDTFPPEMFISCSYDSTKKEMTWKSDKSPFLTTKQLTDLVKYLDNLINNPSGGLQVKEAK